MKDACFFACDVLKRECSQLSVKRKIAGLVQHAGDVHCRVVIVEGMGWPALRT